MITGELKSKVDRIWDTMWSGGISNPLSVIEQLTYLLFNEVIGMNTFTTKSLSSVCDISMGQAPKSDAAAARGPRGSEGAGDAVRIVHVGMCPLSV